jgi:hypothetical protein
MVVLSFLEILHYPVHVQIEKLFPEKLVGGLDSITPLSFGMQRRERNVRKQG